MLVFELQERQQYTMIKAKFGEVKCTVGTL